VDVDGNSHLKNLLWVDGGARRVFRELGCNTSGVSNDRRMSNMYIEVIEAY
jgi:hypothetical protein